ncbi:MULTISPECIES: PaaI family thioesterase [Mycobacterium]|uniref:Acyl-coenzyme A thioesterase THEM4 n=1 Tax=Mycobacterium colombiense TaxID=339268 RepID=A0A329MHN7_9MYCO|nr:MULTISPECIES: PaaI family thioesterase [Mycobacterium]MDM4139952.1 PaaI family thioesterase [Mycobacterium sp. FLAC0960]RAV16957.1 PaaI family thioesterase [Mycobacterium colombiense]
MIDPPDPTAPHRLPAHTPICMGCGPENPSGLRLAVYRLRDEVYADVTFDERHIGAPGLAHGGAIAAACDDLLGFTLWIAGTPAVTRNLAVEYLAPVPLHQTHRITARISARHRRALHVQGEGVGKDGITRFTATAIFIAVEPEHFAAHGDIASFGELFDRLIRSVGGHREHDSDEGP